ncbi:YhfG family protein [Saccharospirillum impatiens]|uniref:YhfG family protein n=1 Tax=Saccharospirillum impatiens TaxID=169438 RepID=UPI0012F9C89D|nr:YhfG family protein [Saccharospirillum impatiens]
MPTGTVKAKKAYFAKVRRKNYIASLRIEGFDVTGHTAGDELPSKAATLATYKRKAMA